MILGILLLCIAVLVGLFAFVLQIMLLVKIFKHAGVGLGILGIFCGPFAFIWGWMKAKELGMKKLMTWLTISIIVSAIAYGAGTASLVSAPEFRKNIKVNGKTLDEIPSESDTKKMIEDAQKEIEKATKEAK
jgi:hypothetical protein